MAGDWIKIETALPHKPEVMQLADLLGIDELQVVGHLVLFWSWVDGQMSSECPRVVATKRGLDRASCRQGFADALVKVGWLEIDGASIQIPNMDYHLSDSAKKRARDAKNKKRRRNVVAERGQMSSQNEDKPRTREEKRREEKNPSIYIPGEDVRIPTIIDKPKITAAVGRWFEHINADDTHKQIVPNSPQEEATWRLVASWGTPEAETVAAIDAAIAGQWLNLRKPESPRQSNGNRSNGNTSGDFTAEEKAWAAEADAKAAAAKTTTVKISDLDVPF